MIIGKLYTIPFTKQLIVATGKEDVRTVTNKPVSYLSDIRANDLTMTHGALSLSKAYMGIKEVRCSKEVLKAWEHSKSAE